LTVNVTGCSMTMAKATATLVPAVTPQTGGAMWLKRWEISGWIPGGRVQTVRLAQYTMADIGPTWLVILQLPETMVNQPFIEDIQ